MSENTPEHGEPRRPPPPEFDKTQPNKPLSSTQNLPVPPPPPPLRPMRPLPNIREKNKPKHNGRPPQNSGLYLPLWSVVAMLVIVLVVAFGLVLLTISLGGQNAPGGEPRLFITPAPPEQLNTGLDTILVSPTLPVIENTGQTNNAFVMSGPTLQPVVFTATPDAVGVGKTVEVFGVGAQQLNVRDAAGVGTTIMFRVPEKTRLVVIGGPEQIDGLTWWKIQEPNSGQTGWVAANYLQIPLN